MTRRTTFLEPAAVASLLCFGCAAEQVDLGSDKPSTSAQASLRTYAGTWTGHAEAYKFSDESDRVRIAIDDQGQGTVEFGASAPPPPPTGDDHGYPSSEFDAELRSKLVPGFRYPILEASVEDSRLQLRTTTTQLFAAWCPLFTPARVTRAFPQYWSCVESGGSHATSEGTCYVGAQNETAIECGILNCALACECDEEACRVGPGLDVHVDGALEQDGEKLTGTLVKGPERIILRLTRD